jgi:hypothetical protein
MNWERWRRKNCRLIQGNIQAFSWSTEQGNDKSLSASALGSPEQETELLTILSLRSVHCAMKLSAGKQVIRMMLKRQREWNRCLWDFRFKKRSKSVLCWSCGFVGGYRSFGGMWGLKMEAVCSSESSVTTHKTIRRHKPEDHTPESVCALYNVYTGSSCLIVAYGINTVLGNSQFQNSSLVIRQNILSRCVRGL